MTKKNLLKRIRKAANEGWTELDLSMKGLTELPPEIGLLTNLAVLDLSKNNLTKFPPAIGQLTELTELNLSGNKLTALPPEIDQLTELTRLNLGGNRLTELPEEIGKLTNLSLLIVSANALSALPPEISQLKHLKKLKLGSNQLAVLPPELGLLTELDELTLEYNRLSSLPKEIAGLVELRGLRLDHNLLINLPPEFGLLNRLRIVWLMNNQLTGLPPEMGKLTNLESLKLSVNPLTSPPPEIVEQGTKAVLAYLRERLHESEPQWVSKLLVVGEGGVGKTATLCSLRGEKFEPELESTHGITVLPLEMEHPTESDITMQLNSWDFGGQEIYHATHQFFLTNRSLFIVAWNTRHGYEQGKLYYWLDAIQSRAPDSPILLVATHIDERDADIPLAELRAKYPQIVGHCEISNKTGAGVDGLRDALADAAAGLPLMGENWPATWLNAAEAIRANEEKHITPQQLWKIMSDHKVAGVSTTILAQWMHELGDILYYRDDKELNDMIILKPQWVTGYISKVLESDDVIGLDGIFTREHMELLWGDLSTDLRHHFLRLMEQFDLSYRTLEDKEISLVVERLPLDPPDFKTAWDAIRDTTPCREISMKFELNTVPAGIPTWFIARSHRFTTHTHWRTGALFADTADRKHLALVRVFGHERHVHLTVRGPNPHNFFVLLKDGLEVTLARFPGLRIERMIPCLGHNDESCDHEFAYDNLEKAIDRSPPVQEIQCPVAFEPVSVPGLLFGLHWRTQDAVLERIDDLQTTVVDGQQEILTEMIALRALSQREFTNIYRREQSKIESHCPNVFVLRPREGSKWSKLLAGQKVDLQLYCQAPGEWHPTVTGGRYEIDHPPAWVGASAPYIEKLVKFLKHAAPVAGAGVAAISPEFHELIKNDIKLMTELIKVMPNIGEFRDTHLARGIGDIDDPERMSGAALRSLRLLLDEKDPDHVWGGLNKILTPEGHYLWLCDHHAKEYA